MGIRSAVVAPRGGGAGMHWKEGRQPPPPLQGALQGENGTAEHCCICIPGRACVERLLTCLRPSRAPGLCPATVHLTPSAGFNGICNRQ